MALDFLKKLFSSSGPQVSEAPAQEYNGYTITPTPQKAENGWRVMGTIAKDIDGELKTHTFIRADTNGDLQATVDLTVIKAKRIIDEQGERIFQD